MAAEEQPEESKHQQENACHVSDSFLPSPASQPVTRGSNIGEAQGSCRVVCATEDRLALKPATISFEEAAAVPVAAITALQGHRDQGQIERGQRVLIDGASGDVGISQSRSLNRSELK